MLLLNDLRTCADEDETRTVPEKDNEQTQWALVWSLSCCRDVQVTQREGV